VQQNVLQFSQHPFGKQDFEWACIAVTKLARKHTASTCRKTKEHTLEKGKSQTPTPFKWSMCRPGPLEVSKVVELETVIQVLVRIHTMIQAIKQSG